MTNLNAKQVVEFFGSVNASLFFSIDNYENSHGEIAQHTIKLNIDRKVLKDRDLKTLQSIKFEDYSVKEIARLSLIESIVNPNQTRSRAQKNAFIMLNHNTFFCPNTKQISIVGGQIISKKVKKEGVYPKRNSKELTIAKNKLKKELELHSFNYKRFNIDLQKYDVFQDGNKIEFKKK